MAVRNVRNMVALLAVLWMVIGACTTEDVGFIAGDLCGMDGVTLCDADGLVVLECVSGTFQPLDDCGLRGEYCTEETGVATCTGDTPLDQDTVDADKPNLPEAESTITDDAVVTENEEPAGDDTIIETEDEITINDDAVTQDDAAVTDDTTDDDALLTDETTDEDTTVTDDATLTDADTATACTSVALNGTILYNGDYDGDGIPDNMFYTDYTPNTGNTAQDDELMFWVNPAEADVWHTLGTGNNANLSTCNQCLLLKEDWSGTAFAKFYFASGGEVLETVGATVTVTIKDAEFIEVTIGANDVTTVVPGGDCITMPGTHEFDLDL